MTDQIPSRWRKLSAFLRYIVAAILLISATSHLGNSYQFLSSILSYGILPEKVAVGFAVVIPFLQLTISVLLFVNWMVKPSSLLAAGLFTMFSVAQVIALIKDINITCGCFGSWSSQISYLTILEVVLLSIASICLFFVVKMDSVVSHA